MIYTNTDLNATGQYFWEAFPAGSGPADRTTYLFTYIDADPRRCAGALPRQASVRPCQAYFNFVTWVLVVTQAHPIGSETVHKQGTCSCRQGSPTRSRALRILAAGPRWKR